MLATRKYCDAGEWHTSIIIILEHNKNYNTSGAL